MRGVPAHFCRDSKQRHAMGNLLFFSVRNADGFLYQQSGAGDRRGPAGPQVRRPRVPLNAL